jgi:membrane-associated phospholipid phosphatase
MSSNSVAMSDNQTAARQTTSPLGASAGLASVGSGSLSSDTFAASYSRWYARISSPWRSHPASVRLLNVADKGLVYLVAGVYALSVMWLAIIADARAIPMLLVPAVEFVLCTALRSFANEARPYERCQIHPLIIKKTHGKSFPSRHISSAAIISCALLWLMPVAGVAGMVATAAVCGCRIIGGVHYPRDVFGALALAFGCGALGFVVIPW